MAIDKERTKELIARIDDLFDEVTANLPISKEAVSWVKEKILSEALAELRKLVEESRPPSFFLLRRSGHGKSSLINGLANQDFAKVGHGARPTTQETTEYRIKFPQRYSEWVVYDSRGVFEITKPDGAEELDKPASIMFSRSAFNRSGPNCVAMVCP